MRARFLPIAIMSLLLCSALAARFVVATSVASDVQQTAEVAATNGPSTATVSGTIRHNGNPVSDVKVALAWEGGERGDLTESDGVYSVSGVPTGSWVMVLVQPPVELKLAYRSWRTEELSGDLVKDFDLQSGYRLQGELRLPDGTPHAQGLALEAKTLDFSPPEGEWLEVRADENGRFDVILPPSFYRLIPMPGPSRRYSAPSTTVDLRSGDVTGMTITMQFGSPFPTTPPDASKITVGDPDVDGYATVTGAAGAVPPLADLIVINLSANNVMTATADTTGAFTASLFAPPGSSLLVKYEIDKGPPPRIEVFWGEARGAAAANPRVENLNPLPGTTLYVGEPMPGDGETQPFNTVSAFMIEDPKSWAGWWMSGTLQVPPGEAPPGLIVAQGQSVTLTAKVRVTSPAINCTGTPAYNVTALNLGLRYLFDAEGRSEPWNIWFNAHLFTPTGLPIEHEASGEFQEISDPVGLTSLTCMSSHAFEGDLQTRITIPVDLPDGIYRPEAMLMSDVPLSSDVPLAVVWYHNPEVVAGLPSIKVGSPAVPRIPCTLLGDYPVNGHRGLQAREDVGHFMMSTRALYPPHEVIIPRLDERTGNPLVYRLEPEAHWLSGTDRSLPPPPHIPLALPSGELIVEVLKPDGTVDQLGPAPVLQSSVRTPTTPGGAELQEGTGHIGDVYHLSTMNDEFAYTFDQYGHHVIYVFGEVHDIYGNAYPIQGTYDVTVARVLDLDPAQLPTTPYMQGDAFAPGLHVFPPFPAEVTVQLVHMPYSDVAQAITTTLTGQANRFGYFQSPAGGAIDFELPGEFRVDITAVYTDADDTLWMGAMTWGNVVEGPNARIEAHGRRGVDYKSDTIDDMPAWFEVFNLPPEKIQGAVEIYYPYFSGDVHWGDENPDLGVPGDSIHSIVTIKDLTGSSETFYDVLRDHFPRARNCFRWPPTHCTQSGLDKRIAVGEAPLFITTNGGIDPAVKPEDIDLWGYSYGSSERPDVHVREIISEDGMGTAYWRFNDTYGYQIGEPADGDQPGDIKWEFGGAVLRTITETSPLSEYAIYSSLWVLLPHNDAVGPRVTPPFRGAGALDGGPIMTLLGEEIDMLFLPKAVRPGDVLEMGDVVAFSGHVGPPLDSRVSVTITSPSNVVYARTWHANKIGWLYDPSFDFVVDQPGRWTVDVAILHDRPYAPTGVTPTEHNTGTVLGTSGQYEFYVVEPSSPRLTIRSPQPGLITWPNGEIEPIHIQGIAPAGTIAVHYTIHDKGVVMGQSSVLPDPSGVFTVTYDAKLLHEDFSMLSLTAHEGRWEGLADEVVINLLAVGGEPRANTVTLIGEEVFVGGGALRQVYLPLALRNWRNYVK